MSSIGYKGNSSGGGSTNVLKPSINFTTEGIGTYVFDGTVTSYNPDGLDLTNAHVSQFFLIPMIVNPANYTWTSATATLVFSDIANTPASLNYYL